MKINENEPKTIEVKRRRSEEKLKSLVIVVLAAITVGAGYYAFDQHRENTQLSKALGIEESNSQYVMETFRKIEENLAEIRSREGVISRNMSPEQLAEQSQEDRIFGEIAAIEELTAENKRMIDELNKALDDSNGQLDRYKKSSAALEKRVAEYKTRTTLLVAEAAALRDSLERTVNQKNSISVALNFKENEVAEKNRIMEQQAEEIQRREEIMRTAYYKVGTYKRLKSEHVVYKEGGIAGLAAVKTIRPDVDKEQFKKIDIYEQTLIPVNSKDPELVTQHDVSSYEWVKDEEGNVTALKITNPDKFWKTDRYLVIVTRTEQEQPVITAS